MNTPRRVMLKKDIFYNNYFDGNDEKDVTLFAGTIFDFVQYGPASGWPMLIDGDAEYDVTIEDDELTEYFIFLS